MDAIKTNDVTDSQQRYERALLTLATRLEAQAFPHRLVVDDQRGGDRIALVTQLGGELVELAIDRHDAERGTACLLTQSPRAARAFAAEVGSTADRISRLATVRRGCVLKVIALARALSVEAEALRRGYPHQGLEALRQAFADAQPMVGLRAELHPVSVFARATDRELSTGFVPVYGAVVSTAHGPRAARWSASDGGFALPPAARRSLIERFGRLDPATRASMAVAGPVAFGLADDSRHDERSFDRADASDCACDLCELPSCDLHACDLGRFDLGGCFDVLPDCAGGLDCVPLDCGF